MPRALPISLVLAFCAAGLHGTAMLDPISMDPVSYVLRFPAPQTHYVEVEVTYPTAGRPEIELMMAVWTPGSYLVREFARNVEGISAVTLNGEPLAVEKTLKNRWRVATGGAPQVAVRYRVYAREMSVRTSFIEAGFAILNGASIFLTLAGDGGRPHDVRLVLPPEWKVSVAPLDPAPDGGEHAYRAVDFDALVDAPLYAGNARVYRFEIASKPHLLVNEGEGGVWDGPRSAADVERIAREQVAFWGVVPYPRYVFFNLITEAGGGLEHADSCLLMTDRWRTRTREGYADWLGLVAHEFFHAWNVKRLRPEALGPFDYEEEVYTRDLWIAEGMTSYYDDLLVHRAGLYSRKELLKRLGKQIESLETTPGRLVQPLGQSSFDTWIKQYRRDENTPNSAISYYTKGAIVSFLLDAKVRRATGGARSLDDALRLAYQRYSGERGFSSDEFRKTVEEVAGTSLGPWFARAVDSVEELDYSEALDWYGLRFAESDKKDGEEDKPKDPEELPAGWLGLETEVSEGRLVVTEVRRGTPGYDAGVNAEDEILAIGDFRVAADKWEERLKAFRPGEAASLLVARRERLVRLPVTFGAKPKSRWKLEIIPGATEEQKARLEAWLRPAGSAGEAPGLDRPVAPLDGHGPDVVGSREEVAEKPTRGPLGIPFEG